MLAVTAFDALCWKGARASVRIRLYHYILKFWIAWLHSPACIHLNLRKHPKQFTFAAIDFPTDPVHLDWHVVRLAIYEAAFRHSGDASIHGIANVARCAVVGERSFKLHQGH